ncbi:MAG: DivIVA domain-containing protein [Candidatus Zixiibacteriota bacterium]
MDLSPNDIRNYEFPNQMRGYDKDEVDSFKEQVANIMEGLKHENLKLSMEIDSLKSQLAGLKQFEDTIKNAAIDARRNADMTVANARKEAEQMLARAKAELENSVKTRLEKVKLIENKLQKIELTKKSYINKVRSLLKSHLDMIENLAVAENVKEDKEGSLEITDSSEVQTKRRETIATPPRKDRGIKTEEAKAADKIIPAAVPPPSQNEPRDDISALRDAVRDEAPAAQTEEQPAQHQVEQAPEDPKNIDPELAAALESYQKKVESEARGKAPAPAPQISPDNVTVTNDRAEDIPRGFVAQEPQLDDNIASTDKMNLAPEAQESPTEHNTINIDNGNSDNHMEPEEPNELARELDEVVAKFEEEMDKAEKS